jgi:hypothetical protein
MCDCGAEEGHPSGHEKTRQRRSLKSRRLHRVLLRADVSAHDNTTINAAVSPALLAQSSRLAEFGGLGTSFNICRGTLGSLAMFTAIRNASLLTG